MKSKTIIVSAQNDNNMPNGARGILTLYQDIDILKCKLRLYNSKKPGRNTKLGLYYNNEVFSATILDKGAHLESSFAGEFDINNDFYCAVVDSENNNEVLLSGGTYAGYYFEDNGIFTNAQKNTTHDYEEAEIEAYIDECILKDEDENVSTTSEQNEEFYNVYNPGKNINETKTASALKNDNLSTQKEEPRQADEAKMKMIDNNYLSALIPQFQYIFENYTQDDALNRLIENARFVSINEESRNYSIGAIYEDDEMKYICYAVKCDYNAPIPDEIGKYYQWLPIDNDDPLSDGYYIVYQDTVDLKIIEV